ncbi:N-6 DNA methylase [Pelagicoccus sp. SDUM812005]|uniref:class I SAM-dependent DNA methyltransferase n=1 Tax=Pelagicoccus sp. SDUM812005 TaxID=3041257 RepID=UPI002810208C|nr:N-6 DNA methylase [Pelagicoccus sp. SDUM812005]MDQ8182214.1 N-6 DNA methylase [Pelagicoccus sp. SDUM812005]
MASLSNALSKTTFDIVQKLWNLCNILRDDGVQYSAYVTELTYLLFLKMAEETPKGNTHIPVEYRWPTLAEKDGKPLFDHYRKLLLELGNSKNTRVAAIFTNAQTSLRQPRHLHTLVSAIDGLDWYSARQEGLGDLYEGLLQKNAEESKSGAGQYFTPRSLIDSMVRLMQPQPGEVIHDPAAGTLGFLVAADHYIKEKTDQLFELSPELQEFQKKQAFYGMELVPSTHRLALMNALLHDIHSDIFLGDTLSEDGKKLANADLVLTNPPFGTKKGGGTPTRDDFTFDTSNKQLAFLQHIYRSLRLPSANKPGGRAAVVLPDNVLFEDNTGAKIRRDLMDKCNLHTILRLPTGIFYAQGVKTNVLFFQRHKEETGGTKNVWVYDMRSNMPKFGKRTPLTEQHFADFEKAYGKKPNGTSKRIDQGDTGRFRKFTRQEIADRNENLDLSWLRDESSSSSDELPEPDELAAAILERLQTASDEIKALQEELGA